MLVTYVLVVFLLQDVHSYIEKVEISGCQSCALRLTCRHFDSVIAVLDATFEPQDNSTVNENTTVSFPALNIRMALNQRCSGVNHCSFILTKDCPGADQWGLGNLTIKYACVADKRIIKYCNKNLLLPSQGVYGITEGFIHNPGYPRFYLGRQECRWRINVPSLQTVKIILFDISLLVDPNSEKCTDIIQVKDSDQVIFSSCEQQEPPVEIQSRSNSLEIILTPSFTETLIPRRGVLFYYTAIGCPIPKTPRDGYLVYRNDTAAEYKCCVGFIFPDLMKRSRVIQCLGHVWDTDLPLPDCDNNTKIIGSSHVQPIFSKELKNMSESSIVQDIVIPTIIMVILFLINSIVIFVIYRYRQRKDLELAEEESNALQNKGNATAS